MAVADLLARLDGILAELQALRAEMAGQVHLPEEGAPPFDGKEFPDGLLIDTTTASERFGYPRDTIAKWCREGDGEKVGGRWLVSIPRLTRRLNGG
jgi:hypothetical protein